MALVVVVIPWNRGDGGADRIAAAVAVPARAVAAAAAAASQSNQSMRLHIDAIRIV